MSPGSIRAVLADYLNLTKPKIMVLLLISTCCPMVLAANGFFLWEKILWVILCGALVSGSASAFNCVWDRDIDILMERTKNRPIAAGRIKPLHGFIFALMLGLAGFFLFWFKVNPLAAIAALSGNLFYVLVYSMWLKRSTPQNIVIGGAAGSFPPLVGWAAVTNSLDISSLLIAVIVFLWTPPHFWALALNKNQDYRKAGIPMMPVVGGEEKTQNQMFYYALSLIPAVVALYLVNPNLGWFTLVVTNVFALVFLYYIFLLLKTPFADRPQREKVCWKVFGFSSLYLAVFFFSLVIDSAFV